MRRILVYGLGTAVGGMEEYMMNLFRNIDRSKFVFDIIPHGGKFFYAEDEVLSLGGQVYKITDQEKSLYQSMKELNVLLKKLRSTHQIIYFNSCGFYNIFPFLLARKYKYTIITHGHNTKSGKRFFLEEIVHCLNRIYIRHISKYCFACSKPAGGWIFGKHYFDKGKVQVIYNAIDCEKFQFDLEKRKRVRRELNLQDNFVIGHVGRFVDQKNHDFLLDIFNEVHQEDASAKLLLIGDGELRSAIEQKVIRLGLERDVLFSGRRNDIPELMWAMDVFVFPSHFEGLGIVTVEAQAAGLYSIASNKLPHEVELTDLIEKLSLNQSAEYWAKNILKTKRTHQDRTSELQKKGYEIKNVSIRLQQLIEKTEQSIFYKNDGR